MLNIIKLKNTITWKNTYFLFLSVAIATTLGCKKEKNAADISQNTKDTPGSLMLKYLSNSLVDADYTVMVSSARGFSLYEEPTHINESTMSAIEGYSKQKENVGELSVNDKKIPFKNETYFYQIDTDETLSTTDFTGTKNHYVFNTTASATVPSFDIEKYSPTVTSLSFEGLVEKKINASKGFTINWVPDADIPGEYANGLVILATEMEDADPLVTYFEVNDHAGNYTINSDDLSQFVNHGYVYIYYARGYSSIENISGKNIDFRFLTYGWAKIYFK